MLQWLPHRPRRAETWRIRAHTQDADAALWIRRHSRDVVLRQSRPLPNVNGIIAIYIALEYMLLSLGVHADELD